MAIATTAAFEDMETGGTAMPRRLSRIEQLQQQIERLKDRMRIAVLYGGDKNADGAVLFRTGNPRPWKSYRQVAEDIAASLRRIGFQNVITLPDDMNIGPRLRQEKVHFVWLNTGGVQGLGAISHAPSMLEMFGLPYVGHNPLNAGSLDFKHLFKRDLQLLGLPTAPFMTWHMGRGPLDPATNGRFRSAFGDSAGPFIIKPVSGRASLHVHVAHSPAEVPDLVREVFDATENHVLIEGFLSGREYCVAVCGPTVARSGALERLAGPFAFAAIERQLDDDEEIFTSMDQKPITSDRLRCLDPTRDGDAITQLREIAMSVYNELDIETLVRLDVRADQYGRMHVLEANPKPDLAAPRDGKTSIIAEGLAHQGMSYDDLILSLLADRLDLLFSQRRGMAVSIEALLAAR